MSKVCPRSVQGCLLGTQQTTLDNLGQTLDTPWIPLRAFKPQGLIKPSSWGAFGATIGQGPVNQSPLGCTNVRGATSQNPSLSFSPPRIEFLFQVSFSVVCSKSILGALQPTQDSFGGPGWIPGHPCTPGWGPPGPYKGLGWMPLRASNPLYGAGQDLGTQVGSP